MHSPTRTIAQLLNRPLMLVWIHKVQCSLSCFSDIVPDSLRKYSAEKNGQFQKVILFECRGLEPTAFDPRVRLDFRCCFRYTDAFFWKAACLGWLVSGSLRVWDEVFRHRSGREGPSFFVYCDLVFLRILFSLIYLRSGVNTTRKLRWLSEYTNGTAVLWKDKTSLDIFPFYVTFC